jgi:hypothetical protein
VSASSATTLSLYKLSPRRVEPSQSGAGLPVPKNTTFVSSSYAPAFQTPTPPVFHESPDHVS